MGRRPMIEFMIGQKVRIFHYPDWHGVALLSFDDEDHRIPGEAARIIVTSLRRAQTQPAELPDLVEQTLACTKCAAEAGTVWIPAGESAPKALCGNCADG